MEKRMHECSNDNDGDFYDVERNDKGATIETATTGSLLSLGDSPHLRLRHGSWQVPGRISARFFIYPIIQSLV